MNARFDLELGEFAEIVVSDDPVLKRSHKGGDGTGERSEFHRGFTRRYLAQQSSPN